MAQKEAQPTQQFVDVAKIKNGVVILKDGGLRKILMVNGINFELKSEDEQNIIIRAYQDFLNSLDFSLQIIIHSRKSNIDNYLDSLELKKDSENNELLKEQLTEYIEFIRSFIKDNEIMTKNFFVSVPYNPDIISEAPSFLGGFFGKKKTNEQQNQSLDQQISQLNQRVDQVIGGLSAVGLRVVALEDKELVELFYNLYNPKVSS